MKRLAALVVSTATALGALVTPAAAETVTVGASLSSPPGFAGTGTCAFDDLMDRPCVIVPVKIPGAANLTSPCEGTVVRFRLSGYVKPVNNYSIRVMRRNSTFGFTSLAKSAAVQIQQIGVNEYSTNLPIAAGDYIGVDFESSVENGGLNWVAGAGVYEQLVYKPFDSSGTDSTPNFVEQSHYLFNADVECKGGGQSQGPPTVPNNSFTIGKVVGRSVLVDVGSVGEVRIVDGSKRPKAKASAAGKGKKAKPKVLKPSSARGGSGEVKVPLKLTKAAKAILMEKGKVRVTALVTFAPDGGTSASQIKKLTIKSKPGKR
jgi:hypothetical protein